jgi:putative alpha-1,2-mannosidase
LVLGSPLFSKIVIHRPGHQSGDIVVKADGAATDSPYVQSLKVNGEKWTKTWLPENFVEHGGTVEFQLSGSPEKSWGTAEKDAPPSFER